MPSGGHNKGSIGAKVRQAIRYLLEVEDDLQKAAQHGGMTTVRVREALGKPHVRRYFLEQKRLLVDVICAGNPVALKDVRDTSKNHMARVAAVRALEGIGDDADQQQRHQQLPAPGLVVAINAPGGERVTISSPPPAPQLPAPEPDLSPTPPLSRAVNEPAFRGRRAPPPAWPADRD